MKKPLLITILVLTLIAVYIPPLFIVIIFLVVLNLTRDNKPPQVENPSVSTPVIENPNTIDYTTLQAMLQDMQKYIDEDKETIKNTDLRQFMNRNDVTKEELAQYMWEQKYWDGAHERHLQMVEISKHCNITEDDIKWVEQELTHYPTYGRVGKAYAFRNDEAHMIWKENNKESAMQTKELIHEIDKSKQDADNFDKLLGIDKFSGYSKYKAYRDNDYQKMTNRNMNNLRTCDYDTWLTWKGYIK